MLAKQKFLQNGDNILNLRPLSDQKRTLHTSHTQQTVVEWINDWPTIPLSIAFLNNPATPSFCLLHTTPPFSSGVLHILQSPSCPEQSPWRFRLPWLLYLWTPQSFVYSTCYCRSVSLQENEAGFSNSDAFYGSSLSLGCTLGWSPQLSLWDARCPCRLAAVL